MDAVRPRRRRIGRRRTVVALTVAILAIVGTGLVVRQRPPPLNAEQLLERAQTAGAVVPPGKVLHIVVLGNRSVDSAAGSSGAVVAATNDRVEEWISNGQHHQLLRETYTANPSTTDSTTPILLVSEDAIWQFSPEGNTVTKRAYDPSAVPFSVAQAVEGPPGLQHRQPNAGIVGHSTVIGRAVTEVEWTAAVPPLPDLGTAFLAPACPPAAGSLGLSQNRTETLVVRNWIDSQTYHVLQQESTITDASGHPINQQVWKTTVEALEDASRLPADFFTFSVPSGASIHSLPALADCPSPAARPGFAGSAQPYGQTAQPAVEWTLLTPGDRQADDLSATADDGTVLHLHLDAIGVFDCRVDCFQGVVANLAPLSNSDSLCIVYSPGLDRERFGTVWKLWIDRYQCHDHGRVIPP